MDQQERLTFRERSRRRQAQDRAVRESEAACTQPGVERYKCRNCGTVVHVRPQLCPYCSLQITAEMKL